MPNSPTYIDLFAGAGGLSEGFIRAGFHGVAHIEADANACATLETRLCFWYLKKNNQLATYDNYLLGNIGRDELLSFVPRDFVASVINREISSKSLGSIYRRVDSLRANREIDLIVGGPPCQAYSLVGRSRDPHRMVGDPRNYLFRPYARFLARYTPKLFVFENVLGLLSAGNRDYLNEMCTLFRKFGYQTDLKVINSEDYGVLQKRRRVIIIGKRGNKPFRFPSLRNIDNKWQVERELFADLPSLSAGDRMDVAPYSAASNEYLEMFGIRNGSEFTTQHITRPHSPRDLEIYALAIRKWNCEGRRIKYSELPGHLQTHKNTTGFLDRFKVVDGMGHSHTMMAHIAKDGHYYIYPSVGQLRSISVREAARIQSFPDDYFFEGGRSAAFRQIGNAVPPLVAEVLARSIKDLM